MQKYAVEKIDVGEGVIVVDPRQNYVKKAKLKPSRYASVNTSWPETIPPCSWEEADCARRKLVRHFKIRRWHSRTRRCWVSSSKTSARLDRGWRRLAHDLSHGWFATVYPKKRPHDPLHVWYEQQVVSYIVTKGWLAGRLKSRCPDHGN